MMDSGTIKTYIKVTYLGKIEEFDHEKPTGQNKKKWPLKRHENY